MSKKTNILIENAFNKNLSEFETNFKRLMKEKVALTVRKTLFEDTHIVDDENEDSINLEDDEIELDIENRLEEEEGEKCEDRLEEEEEEDEDDNVISEMIQKLIRSRLSEKVEDEDEDFLSEDEENENVETGEGPDSNDIEAMEDLE